MNGAGLGMRLINLLDIVRSFLTAMNNLPLSPRQLVALVMMSTQWVSTELATGWEARPLILL